MSTGIDFTLTSGTAPFIVVYDDGAIPITSSFNSTIGTIIVTPNDTTTYTLVSVTDANGCTTIQTFIINENPELIITLTSGNESSPGACDGWVNEEAVGGCAPYSYLLINLLLQTLQE